MYIDTTHTYVYVYIHIGMCEGSHQDWVTAEDKGAAFGEAGDVQRDAVVAFDLV